MDIYSRIDELLRERNLSRRQLAREIGIPPTSLQSAFTKKSKSLNLQSVKDIATALDVSIDYLIGNEDEEEHITMQEIMDYLDLIDLELAEGTHGGQYEIISPESGTIGTIYHGELLTLYEQILAEAEARKEKYIAERLRLYFMD